jgi:HEPN domain-containing protein
MSGTAPQWLDKAQDDLLASQRLFNDHHPKQVYIICYLCQQCAEKSLKAYLVFKDYDFPFIHDLGELCGLCSEFDSSFGELMSDCLIMTPYATKTRYPNEIEIDEQDAKSALQKAERILTFVDSLITPKDESS